MYLSFSQELKKIVYPDKCVCCKQVVSAGEWLCEACEGKLPLVGDLRCLGCGKKLYDEDAEYCYDCAARKRYCDGGVAALEYTGDIKDVMYDFKYKNKRHYAAFFADMIMDECMEAIEAFKLDFLIPVPMFEKKMKQRGYNQAALICDELVIRTGINGDFSLHRGISTRALKELSSQERSDTLMGSIYSQRRFDGQRIGVVDDIYTTGATVNECARALKSVGAQNVYSICACIGQGIA